MSRVKVALRVPTKGLKRGAVIEVDESQAEALIANGSARPVAPAPAKKAAPSKSDKD